MNQKILIMSTPSSDLRSEAEGWTCEDGDLVRSVGMDHDDIWRVGAPKEFHAYAAPLLAIGDGWSLLAPPTKEEDGWTWWFTKGPTMPDQSADQEGR